MSITLDGSNLTTTGVINSGTAQNSTSGTAISFTGIPSGVKRITMTIKGVQLSSNANLQVQIGSGSYTTTGYSCGATQTGNTNTLVAFTTGLGVTATNSSILATTGIITFVYLGSNVWVGNALTSRSDYYGQIGGTSVTLGGTLDRIQLTSTSTDTFTAGSINILYE